MKKIFLVLIAFVLFSSHDMYLKLGTYFLQPNTSASIQLLNGTFEKSENVISRDRMVDVSLVGNGKRSQIDTAQWSEKESMTILSFETGEAGTWVAGVSTRPRNIEMTAADFNDYLEHDGVVDMLEWRQKNDALEQDAVEKYSKHVKAIFQVGDQKTDDWQTALGHPIEFIPLSNPYDLHAGHALEVKLLWQGEPLANQLVYVGSAANEHSHDHADATEHEHSHDSADAAEHEHSHDHADAADHEHSHDSADATEHEHSHDNADATEHGHSHDNADATEHGHSHDSADATEHEHSHDNADATEHEHSHDSADATEHGHSHDNADATEHEHSHDSAAEHEHSHDEAGAATEDHHHHAATQLRTDADGKLSVNLTADGIWYLRTIHLTQSEEAGLTHESNWATLTFEVGHGHSHDETAHTHADEHVLGIPAYVYWIGSFVLLLALFFWFNRKN